MLKKLRKFGVPITINVDPPAVYNHNTVNEPLGKYIENISQTISNTATVGPTLLR